MDLWGDADILPQRRIHTAAIKGFLVEDHIMLQEDKCHTQRLQFLYFISRRVERAFKYSYAASSIKKSGCHLLTDAHGARALNGRQHWKVKRLVGGALPHIPGCLG